MSARLRHLLVAPIASVCLVAALGSATSSELSEVYGAPAPHASDKSLAMSDQAKRNQMLDILETFVPHAESYHQASDLAEPRTDFYDASGPGVTQPRGAGNIALAYTTLLTERPDQRSFGGVSRETMLDHTVQSIRHEALTSTLSDAGYDRWGGGTWQASLETYGWGWAAHLLWDRLDAETRALVERVVVGEADILITKPVATATEGNTGAEDNAWNTPTPALAAVMFPDHPNRSQWEETAIKLAINASTVASDEQSGQLIDGRPLSEWADSVNLQPDLTIENHGFFNPIYQQVVPLLVGEAAAIYASAGHDIPEGFSFRTERIWNDILGPLVADDGDIVMPAGQDWTSKDYQHLDYLTVLATRFGSAHASVAESRALHLLAQRQSTHDNGSLLGQPQLGYESHLIKRLVAAYWNHVEFGPSPQPTQAEYDADRAVTGGRHTYETASVIQSRQRDALVTMSWDSARPMGLVVPSARGHLDDPIMAAYLPASLVGEATGPVGPYSCDCRDEYFSTAGTIGQRQFSMTSFRDGMTMLLDRGEGSTFSFGFESIPGLTGPRQVHSTSGTGLGELDGTWANIADRFGLVVAGGAGLRATEIDAGNPHLQLIGSRGPLNYALGAPITASSNQPPYPPTRANDGNTSTFWVSQEPATADSPQWLEIDLGQEREISRLSMTPRPTRYGPRDMAWQVPDGAGGWRTVATAEAAGSGPTSVSIDPVTTSRMRLLVTSGHDPRNVQVAEIGLDAGAVEAGTNRGAAVYPILGADNTERLSAHVRQPAVPDGWSALYAPAPDGTGRLAVARWAGPTSARLLLGTDRGAPLTRRVTTVDGGQGGTDIAFDGVWSQGEKIRFFVRSDGPIDARAVSGHNAVLVNTGGRTVRSTITYVDTGGRVHTATAVVDPGERARAVGDRGGIRVIVR